MKIEKNKDKISRKIFNKNLSFINIMSDLAKIFNNLNNSNEFKNSIFELLKPHINLIIDKISIYLIIFILLVLISFIFHLGILIILIKYLNKNKVS